MTRTAGDLNDCETWPFLDGAEEFTIKVQVCSYVEGDPKKGIASYQCWIDPRDSRTPRAVGIRANPVAALRAAITDFHRAREKALIEDLLG